MNLKLTKFLVAILVVCYFQTSVSQTSNNLAFSLAKGKSTCVSLGLHRLHSITKDSRFKIGYGLRFNWMAGKNLDYITAPASVSEGNFFKKQNINKLDTLKMNGSSGFINAGIYMQYKLLSKLFIAFNIDAIGFSFGGGQTGNYSAKSINESKTNVSAKPTSANVLLTGDYDIGSLNSEILLKYLLKGKSYINVGVSFVFNEYTTNQNLSFNNNRFRTKQLMPMIGYTYTF